MKFSRLIPFCFPALAYAHPQGHAFGLLSGFAHPWLGTDHWLAMLAVGMLAASQSGIKLQTGLIATFLASLVIGVYSPISIIPLSSIEYLIAVSVGVLGIALASCRHLPPISLIALIGVSGLLHGTAHGVEISANSTMSSFIIGMVLASALLHLGGFGLLKSSLPKIRIISASVLAASSAILLWGL
ncbi:HupE/UreJ family protein [Chitinibacter sp. S2-10]|uniref:HupE/UreJ family protein n=1 Tax=Chitinibacter sp. S2-10 TaxID=3373597 RepID=UPI00397776FC